VGGHNSSKHTRTHTTAHSHIQTYIHIIRTPLAQKLARAFGSYSLLTEAEAFCPNFTFCDVIRTRHTDTHTYTDSETGHIHIHRDKPTHKEHEQRSDFLFFFFLNCTLPHLSHAPDFLSPPECYATPLCVGSILPQTNVIIYALFHLFVV